MGTGLEDLKVLQRVEKVVDEIWRRVHGWGVFAKETVGKQLVRSADSIGTNVAEAFGRYHYGDKINFLYYARGSTFETKYWINRAEKRNLIDSKTAKQYADQLSTIAVQLNNYVRSLRQQKSPKSKTNQIGESPLFYKIDRDNDSILFTPVDIEWLNNPNAVYNPISKRPQLVNPNKSPRDHRSPIPINPNKSL